MGEGSAIGKLKVLEKSLKRSFANVRLDILNIKEYLEKQHDTINSELADLQGQLFSVKRDLKENKKILGEDYVKKEALEKRLKTQIKNLKELRNELEDFDSRITKTSKKMSALEKEALSESEFKKKSRAMSKEIDGMRDELDQEFESIGEELRDIRKDLRKELIREQAKALDKRVRKLDKSLEEVESLKQDLRQILESAKKREKVKKEVVKLEEKITKKPFYKRVWAGFVEFFEEEPEEVVVKKVEKKPPKKKKPKRKPKKKERDYRPIVFGIFIILIVLGLVYYYFSDEIFCAFSTMLGMKNVTKVEIAEPGAPPEGIIITVNETDFVNLVPNASDADKDRLNYTFSYPLNKSGQWQTQLGDAGTYPITVTVSDGKAETKMEFTLVVKPLES